MPGKLGLSETEYIIMSYIWKENREMVRKEIIRHFSEEGYTWASQTVQTFLDILIRKGALSFRLQGHQKVYFPSMSRTEFAAKWMENMIYQNFDNGISDFIVACNSFKGNLTESQKKELEKIWNE
ncbi:MAG: BlaI/MecI/CopY family transcriptional regulator [Eubacteriales bacterium]|nr:BlaI/MecI/CopY family transcriptional regulator [Eubacteriales bacterium]